MDTSRQVTTVIADKSESLGAAPRQRRSIAEKRRIVEETLVEGASVARVARARGINANHFFAIACNITSCTFIARSIAALG